MSAAIFDGFEDVNIAAWIGSAFAIFDGSEKSSNRQRMVRRAAPRGVNILGFIARGIQNTLGHLANPTINANDRTIDFSSSQYRISDRLSFSATSFVPTATVTGAPTGTGGSEALSIPTLLSEEARIALGANGLARLTSFSDLRRGWDDGDGELLDFESLRQMDLFFSSSGLTPSRLGIFMSHDGKLIANWPDQQDSLVELEFNGREISAFFEADSLSIAGDLGDRRFLRRIKNSVQ